MEQYDEFDDYELIKRNNKRMEDVKGMRCCIQCANCYIQSQDYLFPDGMFKCYGTMKWIKATDLFHYRCPAFQLRSCANCFRRASDEGCSVYLDKLEAGIDTSFYVCSNYIISYVSRDSRYRSVLGRRKIYRNLENNFEVLMRETKWLADQREKGNGHYVNDRIYYSKVLKNKMSYLLKSELERREKANKIIDESIEKFKELNIDNNVEELIRKNRRARTR